MSRLTLITGASSGIGLELARNFAADHNDLILVARSKNKLDELAKDLQKSFNIHVHVIEMDLGRHGAALELFKSCQLKNLFPEILVNNAGFGDTGQFATSDMQKIEEMTTLNMECLTLLCRLFVPHMISNRSGKILNIASTAAFQPGPYMAVYYATKAYVLSFSEALTEELSTSGVSVTALCPGPTWSGFQDRAGMNTSPMMKMPGIMTSKEVADLGYKALLAGRQTYITGWLNRFSAFSVRFIPRRLMPKIVARINGKRYN